MHTPIASFVTTLTNEVCIMQVLVPNRSFIGKIFGSALLALALSLGANAMEGHGVQGGQGNWQDSSEQGFQHQAGQTSQYAQQTASPSVQAGQQQSDAAPAQQVAAKQTKHVKGKKSKCSSAELPKCSKGKQTKVTETPCQTSQTPEGQFEQFVKGHAQAGAQSDCGQVEQKDRKCQHTFRKYANCPCVDHSAQFTHVKRAQINDVFQNGARVANVMVVHKHIHGKRLKGHTLRWNDTQVNNVIFHDIRSKHVDIHAGQWHNFVVDGKVRDWEFMGAQLKNGCFKGKLRNLRFDNGFLDNVRFTGAQISRGGLAEGWEKTRFNGATLHNVSFEDADIRAVSFKGATFTGQTSFKNADIHFGTNFTGAKIQLPSGQVVLINSEMARQLDANFHNGTAMTFTGNDLVNAMNAM